MVLEEEKSSNRLAISSSFPSPIPIPVKTYINFICQSDAKLFDFLWILDGHVAFQSEGPFPFTKSVENFAFPTR